MRAAVETESSLGSAVTGVFSVGSSTIRNSTRRSARPWRVSGAQVWRFVVRSGLPGCAAVNHWRRAVRRARQKFAEIVLRETLVFRIEQVFLIQPASGLLMQHVARCDADARENADLTSAMVVAIRDFVGDTFCRWGDTLDVLRVGNLSVYIFQGPHALLAIVVHGEMLRQHQANLQKTLEAIHRRYALELMSFTGDPESLAAVRPMLESCLLTQFRRRRASRERHQ